MEAKRSSAKPKQNLEALLRLAVENSGKDEDVPSTNLVQTDVKRNDFLQNALKAMTGDDFEAALLILKSHSTSLDQKLDSLDLIRDKIDDIDLANSFVKTGGIIILLQYIKSPDYNLRPQSIYIVAEMAQNNEFCQNYFYNERIIPVLTSTMNDADEHVARGSIFAISSLIQNFPPGLNEYLRINGVQQLVSCLKSTHKSVYIKAAFLIGSLSSRESSVRDLINKQNAAAILLNNLENKDEYDDKLDATLNALSALSSSCKWSSTQNQNAQAETILKQIVSNKILLDTCEEMVSLAQNILKNMTKK
ncbi:uncharacterized protein [Drosophila virilis]|uniref:Uncharacterized protein, isoform A n=1 Tax=Drosophila virilis TaxID=7244 RepID=B4LGG4_DROVI|nr:hsp70 nucleotide exchange factor fes1 [Drosophila virilis]XP_015031464.1 hsp70 nucleotide exchange factor fes1 [Drosophila virilis]EDW70493.2 uncharacterized protein Dvir_GJ13802, isoform A [Drosophila virilis]KRF84942.1 uncharacterized protein Dvir_GJ13802, isoform B [Drosophila virilis]